MNPWEEENLSSYKLLLRIEVGLRECLSISLQSQFGAQWQKKLPGEVLEKVKEAQSKENQPQFNFQRLGPLYYLSLGELLPILQQKAGRPTAERFGGDRFLKQLENVLGPRNAICHSRPVSSAGLKALEALHLQMETALTAQVLSDFVANPEAGIGQAEAAKEVIPSLHQALEQLPRLPQEITLPEVWDTVVNQFWWADDALAGFDRSAVETAVSMVSEYNELPRGVGSAGDRQEFCVKRDLKQMLHNALSELEKVL